MKKEEMIKERVEKNLQVLQSGVSHLAKLHIG